MTDIQFPKVWCSHCKNNKYFMFQVAAEVNVAEEQYEGTPPSITGLPFNSKVRCLACNKTGRWNDWQRRPLTEMEREIANGDRCPHCLILLDQAEEGHVKACNGLMGPGPARGKRLQIVRLLHQVLGAEEAKNSKTVDKVIFLMETLKVRVKDAIAMLENAP